MRLSGQVLGTLRSRPLRDRSWSMFQEVLRVFLRSEAAPGTMLPKLWQTANMGPAALNLESNPMFDNKYVFHIGQGFVR